MRVPVETARLLGREGEFESRSRGLANTSNSCALCITARTRVPLPRGGGLRMEDLSLSMVFFVEGGPGY